MKQTIKFSVLIFSLFFISCKETKPTIEKTMINVYSGNYEIKSLNNQQLERKLFFTIDSNENKISGKTDCNTYFGNYIVTNNNSARILAFTNFSVLSSFKLATKAADDFSLKEPHNIKRVWSSITAKEDADPRHQHATGRGGCGH
mgnify:CR=1 FL=1